MIRIFKCLVLCLTAFQLTEVTYAQSSETIIIEGMVQSDIGNPIVNAKVKVMNLGNSNLIDSALTDMAGFYHLEVGILTNVEKIESIPKSFSLSQNYPNPFSKNTNINFTTEKEGDVKLEVFNVIGQKVITLFDNYHSPSKFIVKWDGRNFNGKKIANGMYIYRLTFDGQTITKKMLYSPGKILAHQIGTSTYKSSNPKNYSFSKINNEYNFQINVSHPTIVAINDTLETNANESTYIVNYSTTENLVPTALLAIENNDSHSFKFNCSNSTDDHDILKELVFQCDWSGDGIPDIPGGENVWQQNPIFSHTFNNDAPWNVGIRVKDSDGAISDWTYNNISSNYAISPSDVLSFFDKWNITLGSGSRIRNLINYENDDYFYNTNDETDWVVYKTPNSGGTTPNSSNTRSELRQLSEWTPETGGKLTGTLKVMHVSTSGDARVPATFSVIVGQIHSSEGHENEPLKIFYKKYPDHSKGSVFWNYEINTDGSNSERWDFSTAVWGYDWSVVGSSETSYPVEPDDGIELGEEFSYEINVYDGIMYLTFTSEGHETKTFTKNLVSSEYTSYSDIPQQVLTVFAPTGQDGTERANAYAGELQYFKQGAYNQTNGKDPASNMVWHTGAETYNGNLTDQYANGSYAEVWFKEATVGPGTAR